MKSGNFPKTQISLWRDTKPASVYAKLTDDIEVDVAIVGGGIAGLTTAYLLKQAGLTVAVLEKRTIGSGTTGGTTGKATTQHGLIYTELQQKFGEASAALYAQSCAQALADIRTLIQHEHIDCDWQTADNFVYTTRLQNKKKFEKEAQVAARLNLPASFETHTELPFKIEGAVKFSGQAHFHALKYIHGVAKAVHGQGSYIFEHSNVVHMRHITPCFVETAQGKVRAKRIVIATKVPAAPLLARFTYAAREYPQTSYIIAGKTDYPIKGMYISPDKHQYSLLPVTVNEKQFLLVGGESHIPGLGNSVLRQQKLASYGARWFGIKDVDYRWKAMDYIAYDYLPIAGQLYPGHDTIFTIGGFKKWGLNVSMVAATVVRDLILAQKSPMAKLCDPHRKSTAGSIPRAIAKYISQ